MADMVQIGISSQTSWATKGVQGLREGENGPSLAMVDPF
jgi:hypothetical protein